MIKKLKPSTPSNRHTSLLKNKIDFFFKKNKKKKLINKAGRNNSGRITVQHRGGGHKKIYRIVEFNRFINKVEGYVCSINYDPYRTSNIMGVLKKYNNFYKEVYYVLAPTGIKRGSYIETGYKNTSKFNIGNSFPLSYIPIGSLIHNISIKERGVGKLNRSAGSFSKLLQKVDDDYAIIRLKSGEKKAIKLNCFATIGVVSNEDLNKTKKGKAGRSRWLNKRPSVRGVAKNPIDHPHGGGEGKTSGGRPSVTPLGKITKGKPTRKRKKLIII